MPDTSMRTETVLTASWLAEHIMGLKPGRQGWQIPGFNPLEDIADAWRIVEAICGKTVPDNDKRYRLELIETDQMYAERVLYRARFALDGYELWQYEFTAQEALCHAAYAWWQEYGQEKA